MFENKGLCNSLIEHCSDIITILKTDGTIIFQSTSIRRLLGYEPDELIGKNAFQMVSPDDLPRVMDAFTRVVQTPSAHLSVEYRFRHKDGSWRMLESTGSNQLNNPSIAGIVVNSRDITKRNEIEELLQRAVKRAEDEKAKSEAIVAAIGDGISIQDRSFKVLYQNRIHKQIVEGDKSGEHCYAAYANSDRVCEECPLALSFEDGEIHTLEKRAYREEGILYVEIKASPIRDGDGSIIGGIEVVRDITERKVVQERLQESEERFRSIFDDGPLGMIISDPNHRVLKVNRAFCEMLGYSEEEVVGRGIEELTFPEDIKKGENPAAQALRGESPLFRLEKRFVRKNGESFWVNLTATVIKDRRGKVLYAIGMIEEITNRKAAEQEREQLISRLKEAVANIRTLKGLLPMCAWCKNIRDDEGYWRRVEDYIKKRTDASFTHGICPQCLKKLDPEIYQEILGKADHV
ncbi:MAG TPA: PAS domain S-box protein [Dissulfurispiraceae bacterium]|nr:PAS domain S-box protein [Dissulfurispiraceae bacterium]